MFRKRLLWFYKLFIYLQCVLRIMRNMATNFITIRNGVIEAKLDVYIYKNDGFQIAYSPALDLMGYGRTIKDAKASFEVVVEDFFAVDLALVVFVVEDFFDCAIKNGKLDEYLLTHAWVANQTRLGFVPPKNPQLIKSNKKFQDIFNYDFRKLSVPVNHTVTAC